jgi:hypothetical protein
MCHWTMLPAVWTNHVGYGQPAPFPAKQRTDQWILSARRFRALLDSTRSATPTRRYRTGPVAAQGHRGRASHELDICERTRQEQCKRHHEPPGRHGQQCEAEERGWRVGATTGEAQPLHFHCLVCDGRLWGCWTPGLNDDSNECKRRKIKCNGQTPCQRCGNLNLECQYAPNCCNNFKESEYAVHHDVCTQHVADQTAVNSSRWQRTCRRSSSRSTTSTTTSAP